LLQTPFQIVCTSDIERFVGAFEDVDEMHSYIIRHLVVLPVSGLTRDT
jgi:hypothetical protein